MDYVCLKMNDSVGSRVPLLDSYFQRLVVVNSSPVTCRRVSTFPLTNESLVKSSSLIGRSHSEPKDIDISRLSFFVNKPAEEQMVNVQINKPPCKLSSVRKKKCVTFADDRGCPLVNVTIMTEPSDVPPRINSAVLRALGISDSDWCSSAAHSACTWSVEFPQPASDYTKFRAKLARQCVAVENVLVDNDHQRLSGIIKVKNVSFEKNVFVRYTTDNWHSFFDRPAKFLRSAGADFDSFQFDIDLPRDEGKCLKIEFCVCFKAGGQEEHWDNNEGLNFEVSSESLRKKRAQSAAEGEKAKKSDRKDVKINCTDAFLLDHPNWTEFASWSDLSTNTPYW